MNSPKGFFFALPIMPASSQASRSATLRGFRPDIGQPFGIIQRLVSRVVMRSTCGPLGVFRKHNAPYCWIGFG
ncbi:hypothetical protein ACVIKO_007140 [Rhizobium ruizarguesonis]